MFVKGIWRLCLISSVGPSSSPHQPPPCALCPAELQHPQLSSLSSTCQWEIEQEIWQREEVEAEIMISPAPSWPGCCGLAGSAPVRQPLHADSLAADSLAVSFPSAFRLQSVNCSLLFLALGCCIFSCWLA